MGEQFKSGFLWSWLPAKIWGRDIVLYLSGLNMMAAILNKHQNQEAKLKIVGGVIPRSNQQSISRSGEGGALLSFAQSVRRTPCFLSKLNILKTLEPLLLYFISL